MWGNIAIAFILAFVTSCAITPFTIKLAKKVGAVDIPKDARKIHGRPMPRLGGLAVIAGFFVSALAVILLSDTINIEVFNDLKGFFIGAIIIIIFCFIDDVKDINPWVKLLGQTLAAICVVYSGIRIDNISIPFLNINEIPEAISILLTIGWIVGVTNAINLIDGLDGLSSGISAISTISLLIIFALNESPIMSIILVTSLAGAILGFLPFNFNPAKTFIGDTGSNFLGYCLATISILGMAKTYTIMVIVIPMIILGLPIFDTIFAIIRRIKKGNSIMVADRGHLHHRLMDLGFTQRQSVIILYLASAFLGIVAVVLIDIKVSFWKIIFILMLFLIVGIIAIANIIRIRKESNAEEVLDDLNKIEITLSNNVKLGEVIKLIKTLKEIEHIDEVEFKSNSSYSSKNKVLKLDNITNCQKTAKEISKKFKK